MPIYEYKCTKCGHTFEELRSMSDGKTATCPVCGGIAKKVFSGSVGFIFKGSGFYITDYKKSGSGNGKKSTTEASGKGCKKSAKKQSTS